MMLVCSGKSALGTRLFCREPLRNAGTGIKMSNARGGGVLLIHPCIFLFAVLATGAVVTAF